MNKILQQYFRLSLICLIIFNSIAASGQKMNNTLYLMQNVPQSNQLNPAIIPDCKVFVGFPGLSSVYLNYANNSFAFEDIIHKGTGLKSDSLIIDVNGFHDGLKTVNFVSMQLDYNILSLGIKAKKYFFTLDLSEKNDLRFSFNKDMFTFFKNGSTDFLGKTADFSEFGFNTNHYWEIALGASKKVNDKWTVGVKGKILYGIANLSVKESNIKIKMSEYGDKMTLYAKQLVNVSVPINEVELGADGYVSGFDFDGNDFTSYDFLSSMKNKGFAVDFGAIYQLDNKIKLYTSIIDFGYINWKSNVNQFSQDAVIDYSGPDISQSGNSNAPNYKEFDDVMDDLMDTITNKFKIRNTGEPYKDGLPAKIYFGGTYQLGKRMNFGALNRIEIYNGKLYSSFTLSTNTRFFKNLSTSISYSAVNNTYDNIGFGIAGKIGPLQLHLVSDYILAPLNPKHLQNLNLRFGINMLFGCRDKTLKTNSCYFEKGRYRKEPLYR